LWQSNIDVDVDIAKTASVVMSGSAPTTDSSTVLAEVGNRTITQQQADARLKLQLSNARKAVIDQMVDDYLL